VNPLNNARMMALDPRKVTGWLPQLITFGFPSGNPLVRPQQEQLLRAIDGMGPCGMLPA